MARYQIILAYDGTGFLGSQRQAGARTAQSELEKALRKLGWPGKTVVLAGRTDTGTHASGQVAAFDLDWKHGPEKLQDALNAHLPLDMAVREVKEAADDFHPRFDASSRCYRYRLFCASVRDPLRERYAWRVWPAVGDLTPLADIWPGRHDFAAFGTPTHSGGSTLRTVMAARWQQQADEWLFEVRADAFLYRMVRRLVYTQVAVGQARLPAKTLVKALDDRSEIRQAAQGQIPAGLAPACGLTLVEVCYDNLV
ncbi:MAG: tRNA pseudouridine synthase A [Anaerolineales bacterium]